MGDFGQLLPIDSLDRDAHIKAPQVDRPLQRLGGVLKRDEPTAL
jgi:hypothetical protein